MCIKCLKIFWGTLSFSVYYKKFEEIQFQFCFRPILDKNKVLYYYESYRKNKFQNDVFVASPKFRYSAQTILHEITKLKIAIFNLVNNHFIPIEKIVWWNSDMSNLTILTFQKVKFSAYFKIHFLNAMNMINIRPLFRLTCLESVMANVEIQLWVM